MEMRLPTRWWVFSGFLRSGFVDAVVPNKNPAKPVGWRGCGVELDWAGESASLCA